MSLLVYQPLNDGEIRLLTLYPGSFNSPIGIVLENWTLERSEHAYEALSYAWGDPSRNMVIDCNGYSLKITPSLETALRYLRLENQPRILWIDAICINQDDLEERNEQVPLMRYIYPKATCVIVWLGEADSSTALAFYTFQKLQTLYHRESKWVDIFIALKEEIIRTNGFEAGIAAACSLTFRPWFHRCWAFQEIVLSLKAEIICGEKKLPWGTFSDGLDILYLARKLLPNNASPNTNAYRMARSRHVKSQKIVKPAFLSRFLFRSKSFRATDPRDKFFSLLSLVDFNNPAIFQPRYDMSVQDTNILITRAIIKEELSLCVLARWNGERQFEELPSWVPNWNSTGPDTIGFESQSYAAAADYRFGSTYSVNSGFKTGLDNILVDTHSELHLRGAFIDKVRHVYDLVTIRLSLEKLRDEPKNWHFPPVLTEFAENIGLREKHSCLEGSQEEILLRTLSVGYWYYTTRRKIPVANWPQHEALRRAVSSSSRNQEGVGSQLPSMIARKVYGTAIPKAVAGMVESKVDDRDGGKQLKDPLNEEPQSLMRDVSKEVLRQPIKYAKHRALFFTNRGHIGIGSTKMKLGDMLCTLFGADVPFILRPTTTNPENFQKICECYVDGVMDGELFNVSQDNETIEPAVEGVEISDFTLV
jgi:hypothetical protein